MAHELARLLLEGPDVPVVTSAHSGSDMDAEVSIVFLQPKPPHDHWIDELQGWRTDQVVYIG